eukprot:TRINITY_DN1533_c0_g1_i2.p1 TRINITY_DN1533_c0_g1~~TRINITY_DN1533_c0_g1_i2.p1  ORF type:complete len:448 (+),score=51.03 TRINITY_DN1533_c0_g1_i2:75-1418(+)
MTNLKKRRARVDAAAAEQKENQGVYYTTASSCSELDTSPPPTPKKGSDLLMRTIFTFVMAVTFLVTQYVGQTLGIILVLTCQVLMFREIMRIARRRSLEEALPVNKTLPYYMLIVVNILLVSSTMRVPLVRTWPGMEYFLERSSFVAFTLYMFGLIAFVLSLKPIDILSTKLRLKRGSTTSQGKPKQIYFRYQFNQFGWLHMGLLAIVASSSFFLNTMMEGMIWFTLPVSCVIHNDSWAYACGKLFGRNPLVPTLSPRKTWEGFLGAWFFTTLWAVWFAGFLSNQKRFICPKVHFLSPIDCDVSSTFITTTYDVPELLWAYFGKTFDAKPVQLHAVAFAAFASLGAPFGGFFASGLKRAFNLDDFGDLIPGHGGMVDRMDCQLLMALFVYCYVSNFVYERGGICAAVGMMQYCVSRLNVAEQVSLFNELSSELRSAGVVIRDGVAIV